ncbi:serine carboxypeptidase-like 18 [Sorghum bicolor]|uniref:serine carboxypeptidase-like 18 n=1 Tax=Sorghum bicolor TaxID=4558 RepID=UPI000B426372|nr:serine carboxypeptidase-like 18 [Sorghum bicolor]|eukprot:XP_021317674.1 serine carboxypeptidase-like 18 [Sorghum bicolor]
MANSAPSCRAFSWLWLWLLLLLRLWCLLLVLYCPMMSSALVVRELPGFDGPLPFFLETGYVEVDESNGVQLFYYFVQSERDPASDPLLLWLQGGPGCSGLSGLVYEIGPLLFDVQYTANGYEGGVPRLLYRPETWTKVSNIIFVDSPVGAGFSYASTEEGFKSSDTIAIKQLVIFLKKWLDQHPQFMSNPLYIGGESYCGIIIPALTLEIDKLIRKASGESLPFNLKGYIAGNPMTDKKFDTDGKIKFFHGMGLISDELYELAKVNCRGSYDPPANHQCAKYIESINYCTKDINVFHILEPSCKTLWRNVTEKAEMHRLMLESDGVGVPLHFKCRHDSYQLLYIWTNDETVRKNLGIRQKITQQGSQQDLYTRSYATNLTYATVKGAGHTAPEYKPKECLAMFARWISTIPL